MATLQNASLNAKITDASVEISLISANFHCLELLHLDCLIP